MEQEAARQGIVPGGALLEVNIAGEEQQVRLFSRRTFWPVLEEFGEIFPHMEAVGLMAIPPVEHPSREKICKFFHEMRNLIC